MSNLALVESSRITSDIMDRLIQTLIFFGESVYVRLSYSTKPDPRGARVNQLVHDLHDAGLIRFWAHEHEIDDSGALARELLNAGGTRRKVDLVTNATLLSDRISELDESLRANRESAYSAGVDRQGVGEIIALRQMMTAGILASNLGATGMMTTLSGTSGPLSRLNTTFEEDVVGLVLSQLSIASLHILTATEVVRSRKYAKSFRRLIAETTAASIATRNSAITAQHVATELVTTFSTVVENTLQRSEDDGLIEEGVWDLAGAALPASLPFKYLSKVFQWHASSTSNAPFLLLSQLKSAQSKSRGSDF